METAIALLNLINSATPGIASLIVMIRGKDGKISVVTMLDEADATFASNIDQAKAWLASHPKP